MCTVSYMYVHVYSSTMIPYCIVYHISIIYYHMIDTVLVMCILIPMLRISTVHKIYMDKTKT